MKKKHSLIAWIVTHTHTHIYGGNPAASLSFFDRILLTPR